jgi:hypothetical protein
VIVVGASILVEVTVMVTDRHELGEEVRVYPTEVVRVLETDALGRTVVGLRVDDKAPGDRWKIFGRLKTLPNANDAPQASHTAV